MPWYRFLIKYNSRNVFCKNFRWPLLNGKSGFQKYVQMLCCLIFNHTHRQPCEKENVFFIACCSMQRQCPNMNYENDDDVQFTLSKKGMYCLWRQRWWDKGNWICPFSDVSFWARIWDPLQASSFSFANIRRMCVILCLELYCWR